MPGCCRQLDLDERLAIFRLVAAKVSVAVIAREMGRHRSTIHREIGRSHFREQREYAGYFLLVARDWPASGAGGDASSCGTSNSAASSSTGSRPAGRHNRSQDG